MRSVVAIPPQRHWRQIVAAVLSAVALSAGGYWLSTMPNWSSDLSCPSPPGFDIPMVKIEPGRFSMGAKGHIVEITRPYCLGKFELTQGLWKSILGFLPHQAQDGNDLPVGNVSWNDAEMFISRLAAKDPAAHFRLPTNAQWEYAARAGTSGRYSFGESFSDLELYGNCRKAGHLTPVGHFLANPWGLYDMYGNVSEWVGDWAGTLPDEPTRDPAGPATGTEKIRRGGSFTYSSRCNSTFQVNSKPDRHNEDTGFRIVRDPVR
jgi:formylglycine-generating enzyme required for sulfatase activity